MMVSSRSCRILSCLVVFILFCSFSDLCAAEPIEIILKAELATLSPGMQVIPDGRAIDNLCIHGYPHNKKGWATFEVDIKQSGEYILWGRVHARDGYANSFYVQVDDGEVMTWDLLKRNYYIWEYVSHRGNGYTTTPDVSPVLFYLSAGKHTIKIGNREKETRLDELILTNDVERRYDDHPSTWLAVTSPNMGDVLEPGTMCEITWASRYISKNVNIDLSFDLGETFDIPIVHGAKNTGSYLWQVPDYFNRAKLVIRIADISGVPYDINHGYFSAVNPDDVSLTLLNPGANDTLVAGSIYVIKWKEFAFNGKVKIELSTDNGDTWEAIASNQNAAGENHWKVTDSPSDRCWLKVMDAKDGDPCDMIGPFSIIASPPIVDNPASHQDVFSVMPTEFRIRRNYPNPFNPHTSIDFSVAENGHTSLAIFDVSGRQVAVLVDDYMNAGWHTVNWNAVDFSSGIYTAVLNAGGSRSFQKMTLLK